MDYDGQTNPRYIEPRDKRLIKPYIQWSPSQVPEPTCNSFPLLASPRNLAHSAPSRRSTTMIALLFQACTQANAKT